MTITQLDLFSGIGGFHLGFERAGYEVKSYFSEVDKHAIAVYKHKFKEAECRPPKHRPYHLWKPLPRL
jgi:DNA (cytosine-5)-methyltransferase 1